MILEQELKTLRQARKEEDVKIIPYSENDVHLLETILNMEKTHKILSEECDSEQLGLHYNTKEIPDWVQSDKDYDEWNEGVDEDYKALEKLIETVDNLENSIRELEGKVIVYTRKI